MRSGGRLSLPHKLVRKLRIRGSDSGEKSGDVMSETPVTLLLKEMGDDRPEVASQLLDAVYSELRSMAEAKMKRERSGHTLQPTALVHEAFMRLVGNQAELTDRARFFGAAGKAMERVLVDHARAQNAEKRGGGQKPLSLHDVHPGAKIPDFDLLELREVVQQLEELSPENAEYVRLRCFVGLTLEEIAAAQGLSLATVKRRWTFLRAWLYDRLS